MRAPNEILKTVGFVAEHAQYEIGKDSYDPEATGFFVEMPSKVMHAAGTPYFVTAKHVVEKFANHSLAVITNKKGDGIARLEIGKWYTHSDKSVDVAIAKFIYKDELDFFFTPLECFEPHIHGTKTDRYWGRDIHARVICILQPWKRADAQRPADALWKYRHVAR